MSRLTLLIAAILATAGTAPIAAQEEPYDEWAESPETYVRGCGFMPAVRVKVDGRETEARGFLRGGRAYLPAREVLEGTGGTVTWSQQGKSFYVASQEQDRTVRLTVDSPLVDIYSYESSSPNHTGKLVGTVRLAAAPFQCEGRVFVPVRAATEAAGGKVHYDRATKTVHVTPPARVEPKLERGQR